MILISYLYKKLLSRPFIYNYLWSERKTVMHKARQVIEFYKTKFATILNISNPIPDAGNVDSTGLMSVETLGKYISESSRTYTVEVITGGEIGITVCSITDNVGGTYSNFAMVANTEINVGTHGVKIKFNILDPEYEFSLGDKWVITCDHRYNNNVRDVKNARVNPQSFGLLPGIAMAAVSLGYDQAGTSNNNTITLRMVADMFLNIPTNQDVEVFLFDALEDIETALTEDPQCGNNVVEDIEIYECTPYLPVPGEPIAAISVEFGVRFYNRI